MMKELFKCKTSPVKWIGAIALSCIVAASPMFMGATEVQAEEAVLKNPRIETREDDQTVTWDTVTFGSYPQIEVTAEEEVYRQLESAAEDQWDVNGDIELNGVKYRRMKAEDATEAWMGDYWNEGHYYWENDEDYHYFKYEPIKWRVLSVDENADQALILADIALDTQQYDNANDRWGSSFCGIRNWLNGDDFLYNAFDESEREVIIEEDRDNIWQDVILLLDSEVMDTDTSASYGFINSDARVSKSSDYAKAMGAMASTSIDHKGNCYWWVSSPDNKESCALMISPFGEITGGIASGHAAPLTFVGVRPALRLNLSSDVYHYAGTRSSLDDTGASGTCGDNVNYTFSEGILTISGEGDMYDYSMDSEDPRLRISPFSSQIAIKKIIIKENVTGIGSNAFYNCSAEEVTIGKDIQRIGKGAFASCEYVKKIDVDEGNDFYLYENGVLFNKSKTAMIFTVCPSGEYHIPEGVVRIEPDALQDSYKLESIIIPASVEELDRDLFEDCWNLERIEVSADNKVYASEDGVLFNKEKTTLMVCPQLKQWDYTIPDGVTRIGDGAFYGCDNLESIIVPESVESIGSQAFDDVRDITILNSSCEIEENAIYYRATIHGYSDSTAQVYAEENNIKFIALAETIIPSEKNLTKLEPDKDYKVKITEEKPEKWFSFTPSEDGIYEFSSTSGSGIDPRVYFFSNSYATGKEDAQGFNDDGKRTSNDFLITNKLTAGHTYWYSVELYSDSSDAIGSFTVRLSRKPVVTGMEVEKTSFIERWKPASFSEVKVTYSNGSKETVRVNGRDSHGNYVTYKRLKANGSGSVGSYPVAGNYMFRILCGETSVDIPFTVKTLSDSLQGSLALGKEVKTQNEEGRLIYRFHTADAGRYEILFNVPVENICMYHAEGKAICITKADYSKYGNYRAYKTLKADTSYYLVADVDEEYTNPTVCITKLNQISALESHMLKEEYIAGLDVIDWNKMSTDITYSNGEKTTRKGSGKVDGYELRYRVTKDGTGRGYSWGSRLSVGTYQVGAYLFSTGSAIERGTVRSGSAINRKIQFRTGGAIRTQTTIRAVRIDTKSLTPLKKDTWTSLPNGSTRLLYAFTAPEDGTYVFEKTEATMQSLGFYSDMEEGLSYRGDQITLFKGETCVVVANTWKAGRFRIVSEAKSVDEVKEKDTNQDTVLRVGLVKNVSISPDNPSVVYTIIPEKTAYYKVKNMSQEYVYANVEECDSEDYIGSGYIYSGQELNIKLTAGKTYRIQFSLWGIRETEEFEVLCSETSWKKISNVKLKMNKKFHSGMGKQKLKKLISADITYTDGTTGSYDYGTYRDNDYYSLSNRFSWYLRRAYSEDTENEIAYRVVFEYRGWDVEYWETAASMTVYQTKPSALENLPVNQEYFRTIQKEEGGFDLRVTPEESGEYALALSMPDSVKVKGSIRSVSRNDSDYSYSIVLERTFSDGEAKHSYMLEAGQEYVIRANVTSMEEDSADIALKLIKVKEIQDVEVIRQPTKATMLSESNAADLSGMQVKVIYKDGTTENAVYGQADSQGRTLVMRSQIWLNQNLCRVYARLGEYQVYTDMAAESWDHVKEIQENKEIQVTAGKDSRTVVKFVPQKTGTYTFRTTRGKLENTLQNEDRSEYIQGAEGDYYLEAGKVYYLSLYATGDNPTILPEYHQTESGEGDCIWVQTKYIAPTCTEDGRRTETCSVHGDTREISIPATGKHSYGEWVITKNPTAVEAGEKQRTCTVCGKAKETQGIEKQKATLTLNVTGTLPLQEKQSVTIKVSGLAAGDRVVSWTSSNNKIVSVNASGKITGKKAGKKAVITVRLLSGKTAKVTVKVQKQQVKTKKLLLDTAKKLTLKKGTKKQIRAIAVPISSKEKITYKTTNKQIVSVTSKGAIKAKKKGKATITVTSGKKSVKIKITVK